MAGPRNKSWCMGLSQDEPLGAFSNLTCRHEQAPLLPLLHCQAFCALSPYPMSFCTSLARGSLGRPWLRSQLRFANECRWERCLAPAKRSPVMKTIYLPKLHLEKKWKKKLKKSFSYGEKKTHLKRLLSHSFFKPCRRNVCPEAFKFRTLITFSKEGEYRAESCAKKEKTHLLFKKHQNWMDQQLLE